MKYGTVGVLGKCVGLGQLKYPCPFVVGVDGQLMKGDSGVLRGKVGEFKLAASSCILNKCWLI